ncbi:hypothetical protein QQ045_026302 [Rhodiola kirilowii]
MVDSHNENAGSSTRKKRGRTCMNKLIQRHKNAGTKESITVDEEGNIAGDVSISFRTYIGIVVKSRIPITYITWKLVPLEHRDMALFDVPQNELTRQLKAREMRAAATMWRNFKSKLANKYIFGPQQGEDPTIKYPYIKPDQWSSFVEHRLSPDSLQIRETNIGRAKSNQYQHTLSRAGYKKARAEL